ncbi:60S ribosomal protein L3, partial [Aduncisulcus paluster]
MSHRKFEAPRHGSLGFLPRKRAKKARGKVRSFPKDKVEAKPHLTAFMGYKAGMTHVVREVTRPGSILNKKDVVEAATVIECPPMSIVGVVGYVDTPRGPRALTTVWAAHLDKSFKRRFYKTWYSSKQQAFTKYTNRLAEAGKSIDSELARMTKYCSIIRVVAHTQPNLVPVKAFKAHVMEIQVNGGSVEEKVAFAKGLMEKTVNVKQLFGEGEAIDILGVTRGFGVQGVVRRWGVTMLPVKTRRGNRRVACIGAWHPANVQWSVARHGQTGFHHRTERNKQVLRVSNGSTATSGSTE